MGVSRPMQDPETGFRAMKTIKVVITDEDGTLLDRVTLDVPTDCSRIAVRSIEGTLAERIGETELNIGKQ